MCEGVDMCMYCTTPLYFVFTHILYSVAQDSYIASVCE